MRDYWLLVAASAVLTVGCGKSEPATETGSGAAATATAAIEGKLIDACTFLAKADLEPLVGHELRGGEPRDASPPMSQCSFETPTGSATTRTFPNPPLPDAAGFSQLTVTTFPTTKETFAQSRNEMGAGSPVVTGIGDEAFFSGPAMIFVRKDGQGFSVRAYVDEPKTDAGRAKLQEVMISLGEAGAAKL